MQVRPPHRERSANPRDPKEDGNARTRRDRLRTDRHPRHHPVGRSDLLLRPPGLEPPGRVTAVSSQLVSDIPELNVRLGSWWRLIDDADSGRRRLTLFLHVAP